MFKGLNQRLCTWYPSSKVSLHPLYDMVDVWLVVDVKVIRCLKVWSVWFDYGEIS